MLALVVQLHERAAERLRALGALREHQHVSEYHRVARQDAAMEAERDVHGPQDDVAVLEPEIFVVRQRGYVGFRCFRRHLPRESGSGIQGLLRTLWGVLAVVAVVAVAVAAVVVVLFEAGPCAIPARPAGADANSHGHYPASYLDHRRSTTE